MTATLALIEGARRTAPPAPTPQAAQFLHQLPVLQRGKHSAIDDLAACATVRRVRRGESLWTAGDRPDGVGVVRAGVILLRQQGEEHDVALDLCGRGSFVGIAGGARDDDAVALDDTTLLWWSRDVFEAWVGGHPDMIGQVLELAGDRGRRLASRLALVTLHGAKVRLTRLLLDLGERFGVRDSRGVIVDLRLTHREMASLIGATRETVSVAMVELRGMGCLASEGRRVVLLDLPALREIAGL